MKILHVLDHSVPLHSGYTFRTLSIINQQRALGWHTEHLTSAKHSLSTSQGSGVRMDDVALVEHVDGMRFFRTPEPEGLWRGRTAAGLLEPIAIIRGLEQRLHQLVDEIKPDILHAHSPALNGVAAVRVGKQRGIPVLYECRAFWEDAAVNHGTCEEGSLRYRLTRSLESYVFKQANAITTICEGLRQDIIQRGIQASKVTVIPNAVDIEKFQNLSLTSVDSADTPELLQAIDLSSNTVLGFFGSFYEYEGLSLLLDAMPAMIDNHPDVRLLLVGGGPQEAFIKEKIQQMGLADQVLMTGRVPHQDIQHYYRAVDVMVYPRLSMRLTDLVTPLKPLEAMAMGKLVLASDVGGHRELIEDGRTGFLFQADCPNSLATKFSEVISVRDSWPQLLQDGRNFVELERNWPRSVSRYQDAYAPLCGHRAQSSSPGTFPGQGAL